MKIKTCSKCNLEKPITHFWKNKNSLDGRRSSCSDCDKEYQRSHHYRNINRKASRKYNKSEKAQATRKKWKGENRERVRNYSRNKSPKMIGAWALVRAMVNYGILPRIKTQKCIYCGSDADAYHHHNGYDTWENGMDVVPACKSCNLRQF